MESGRPKTINKRYVASMLGISHQALYDWLSMGVPYNRFEQVSKTIKQLDLPSDLFFIREGSEPEKKIDIEVDFQHGGIAILVERMNVSRSTLVSWIESGIPQSYYDIFLTAKKSLEKDFQDKRWVDDFFSTQGKQTARHFANRFNKTVGTVWNWYENGIPVKYAPLAKQVVEQELKRNKQGFSVG